MAKLLILLSITAAILIVLTFIFSPFPNLNLLSFLRNPSTASAATSTIQLGIQAGHPIDDQGNILITSAVASRMVASGAIWVRVNFRLGPYTSDSPEFYATYDKIVSNLRNQGLQVIGLMSNESWPGSQADWTENNWEHTGGDGYNTYIDQYGYAFTRIAKHYEGEISYWEVWNEPNTYSENPSEGVFQGATYIYPSNFASMLAHVYSQINYYNNINVKIISGGLFGHTLEGYNYASSGADYLNSTYNIGINKTGKFAWAKAVMGTYPLDNIGQHLYVDQGTSVNTQGFSSYLNNVRGVVTRWEGVSSPKKTWLTEFGWTTREVSEQIQSNNLSDALFILKSKNFIASAIWFQLDDNSENNFSYGIYRADLSKKPSWTIFNNNALSQTNIGKTKSGTIIDPILNYYNENGGISANGSPYDNGGSTFAHMWDFGYVQDFKGGSIGPCIIFDTGYRVQQGFWATYVSGNNHGILKFPVNDAYGYGNGTRQDFQGGYMTWDPVNNVRVYPK